ncbi:MAG: hypothetical protein ACRDTX_08705 [Pseudonocardiaceae bacterium]
MSDIAVTADEPVADIAALAMDVRMGPAALERGELGHRVTQVDCYDLDRTPLHRFAAIMVPGMVDQEYLLRHRPGSSPAATIRRRPVPRCWSDLRADGR